MNVPLLILYSLGAEVFPLPETTCNPLKFRSFIVSALNAQ